MIKNGKGEQIKIENNENLKKEKVDILLKQLDDLNYRTSLNSQENAGGRWFLNDSSIDHIMTFVFECILGSTLTTDRVYYIYKVRNW